MTKAIVLDKSYLDGASTEAVRSLCNNYNTLISDELFFELITTRPKSMWRCFAKLPDITNPVCLIPNIGSLLRFEIEHKVACTPVVGHKVNENFQFNSKLRDGSYVFKGEALCNLERWKAQVAKDTVEFIEGWAMVHHFFPELSGIEWKDFPSTIEEARRKTARDADFIRGIYASLLANSPTADHPNPDKISPEWALFRWVQCRVLCGLRLFGRYQGKVPDDKSKNFVEKAEHSMLDSYHVIHGSLVGAMATRDREIREDLLLLLPGCFLASG